LGAKDYNDAIHTAIIRGQLDMVKRLIELGASVEKAKTIKPWENEVAIIQYLNSL